MRRKNVPPSGSVDPEASKCTVSGVGPLVTSAVSDAIAPHGGLYGPLAYYYPNPGNTFAGNIWDESGAPVVR